MRTRCTATTCSRCSRASASTASRDRCSASGSARKQLTEVELTWIEKKFEHWIRFGRIAQDRIVTRKTRVVAFRPGAIFAFVRWMANDYGTISSRINVLRAVAPGEAYTTLPFVWPGGEVLLHIEGWPKVNEVLSAIDSVEAAGVDPCEAVPDHWRHVHNRLAAGMQARSYSPARHRDWLRRRKLQS